MRSSRCHKNKKNNEKKPSSNGRKHMEKEKTNHEEEEGSSVMVGAPPTCNPANAGKVGLQLKGVQRVWFGEGGKRA